MDLADDGVAGHAAQGLGDLRGAKAVAPKGWVSTRVGVQPVSDMGLPPAALPSSAPARALPPAFDPPSGTTGAVDRGVDGSVGLDLDQAAAGKIDCAGHFARIAVSTCGWSVGTNTRGV